MSRGIQIYFIRPLVAAPTGGPGTVGQTLTAQWDIRSLVGNTQQATYDILNLVGTTLTAQYDIRNLIGNTKQFVWDILSGGGGGVAGGYRRAKWKQSKRPWM